MTGISLKSIILGFIAGAIAAVAIHELLNYVLLQAVDLPKIPWTNAEQTSGIPQIVRDAAWGGLWGVIFALILGDVPQGSMTFKGALLGIIGPALIGVLLLVPIINGSLPLFLGGDLKLIGVVALLLAGFGAVTAWIYGFLASGFRLP